MQQRDLFADAARDAGMSQVEDNAAALAPEFAALARDFVLAYLRDHGPSPGEDVTDACLAAGIAPHDLRAFGPVYMRLAREGRIAKVVGVCLPRRRGHNTAGGNVWRLVPPWEDAPTLTEDERP